MSPEENDPILDAFLAELLADKRPPDLAPRILKAWAASKEQKVNGHSGLSLPQIVHLNPDLPPLAPPVRLPGSPAVRVQPLRRLVFLVLATAAGIAGIGLTIGMLGSSSDPDQPFAFGPQPAIPSYPATGDLPVVSPIAVPETNRSVALQPGDSAKSLQLAVSPSSPALDESASSSPTPQTPATPQPPARPRLSDAEIVAAINGRFSQLWVSSRVKPTAAIADEAWCRRVYSGVLGCDPRPAEVKRFLELPESERREKLVAQLLTLPRYRDEFAKHWAATWTTRLLGTRGGTGNSLASREELQNHLAKVFSEGTSFDQVVQELLTATGSALPTGTDYNPAVNFLLERWDANALHATARVGRTLLGHQIRCAQCHQHPTDGWTQEQFWSLNAFFRQTRVERSEGIAKLINVDFSGQRRGSTDGEVFFETPAGLMKTAFPRFIDGTEIATSGMLSQVNRRAELARLLTNSDDFAKATVNTIWSTLYRFALRSEEARSSEDSLQAAALQLMAEQFAAHDYDFKAVVRWSVLSDTFARSTEITDLASSDTPESGDTPLFSRFYERPAVVPDATRLLIASSRIRTTAGTESARVQARTSFLAQANRTSPGNTKAGTTSKKAAPSILADGNPTPSLSLSMPDGGLIKRLVDSPMTFDKKVEHVFLTAIARQPNSRELGTAAELLQASGDDYASALADVWWALTNSSECVLHQ